MIDIHSHILNNVDDGSRSVNDSINIIKNLYINGFTDIILTPHYIEYSSYNSDKMNNENKLKIIEDKLKEENININLYLGNEIFITENILELLKKREISSLNNSKYLLIELPMNGNYNNYIEIFKELIENGYIVILAHPERYISFQKDFEKIIELKNIGILFQCNIGSLFGKYGRESKKLIKKLAKFKIIDFLATDIHNNKFDYSYFNKINSKLRKYYTKNEIEDITINNPKKILN